MPSEGFENKDLLGEALRAHDQGVAHADSVERDQEEQARLDALACPSDPELEGLFRDFAGQMPDSKAVPFLREDTRVYQDNSGGLLTKMVRRNIAGWKLAKQGRVLPSMKDYSDQAEKDRTHTVHRQTQVTRGWPIRDENASGFISLGSGSDSGIRVGIWTGLAVDLEGSLWFARDAFKRGKGTDADPNSWRHASLYTAFTDEAVAIAGLNRTNSDTVAIPALGRPTGQNLRDSILRFCELGQRVNPDNLPELIAGAMAKMIRDS